MTILRIQSLKQPLITVLSTLALILSPSSASTATVNWADGTGFWDFAPNWDSNPLLPGLLDDVTINVTGIQTITVRSPNNFTVNSLTMAGDEILAITGGALTINNTYTNNAATNLSGGTLTLNSASNIFTLNQRAAQISGAGNLTILGPAAIADSGHSGAAITTLQGVSTISNGGLRLDGGRILRNEGTVTQTNADIDLNARRSGAAEAGNGNVLNVAGATWNSSSTSITNFILASNQGRTDTGAGAVFTNAGTFNNQGVGNTEVRTLFDNTGSINVQAGTLRFGSGGRLVHNGTVSVAAGAVLDFNSSSATTQTINTAATTIAGTLSITNDNFVNFTQAHTINGPGTLQQNFGQVIGSNLTLGPTLAVNITGGGHSGAATTTLQGVTTISGSLSLDGGRILRNEDTVTQTNASIDLNARRSGVAETGNGTVLNVAGATWNSSNTSSTNFIFASSQGGTDNGTGAVFTNLGTFNKQGAGTTDVRTLFDNTGSLNVQAGLLSFRGDGRLVHNGTVSVANGAVLDFNSSSATTQTINTAATTIAGTLSITNDNFVNFTQAHTISGPGTFQQNFGQVIGSNLTLGPTLAVNITDGGHSGAATTTLQGVTTISGTGLRLDGGRILRNEGTLTQTNANIDLNSRRSGTAEVGNGTVLNVAGATWNNNATLGNSNFILASNQGGTDTGAGAVFTNAGTFNKLGASTTEVRTLFDNSGSLNVQAGTLNFANGGRLVHNGTVSVAAGAVLDFNSSSATTQTINTAATTIAGTLSITNDNFVNFTQAHTISGPGTFQQNFGQVIGSNLTLGPTLAVNITDGGHSGAATTTLQGVTTISGTGLRLDGGRILRNEGTLTQTNANIDLNSRRSGTAEVGNGTVLNVAGATWNSNSTAGTSFILASNQGGTDTGAGAVFTNAGTFNKLGAGTTDVRVNLANTGLTNSQAGTLLLSNGTQGTGTLQTSGGIIDVRTASTTGNLFHNTNAANSLILGTNNITVSTDYNNSNFGVGNTFNRYANVSRTTGQILAAGDVTQTITGAGVVGGTSNTSVLTIGNVHVGANTVSYQIANTGTTGPVIRGALQTSVNGGNITDARLSGSGVTASNFGPVATGTSSGNLNITFTAANAGALAPLSGQVVRITNNFENVADQSLSIVLGSGAAAYNLAAGSATPTPVTIANQRIGGTSTQVLTVTNTAPAGAFTEGLNASFGTNTGAATNNGGSVSLLVGGASNSSALNVGVNTATAGAKSGIVTLNYISDGTGTSELGQTNVGSQTVNVSGNVYRVAVGATTPTPVAFSNRHVGDTATQVLTVQNTAANDGFSERLNASFGSNTGSISNNGSSISQLVAGGSNSALSVSLDTSSAGTKSGSATVNYQSDGTGTSGLAAIAAGSQTINVTGNVYRLASANTLGAVNFGNVHVGDTVQQALNITNTAISDGFSERLNASFGASSDARITTSGSITQLVAGASNNTSLIVGLNTSAAGSVNGTQTINFASDGTGISGLGITGLASQTIGVSGDIAANGNVFRFASASAATPNPVNFGNVRVGTVTDQVLTISNTAANDGFSERLNASISSNGAPVTATGTFNLLGPQATDSTSLRVGIDTSSAGAKSGSATIALVSDGTGTSNLGTTNLTSQTVNVSGNVYRLAQASAHTPEPVTLANQRIGGTATQALSLTNTAVNDGFSESLNASFSGTGGAATASGSFSLLNAGATNNTSLNVGVDTSTAGAKIGTATIALQSDGAGTSALAAIGAGTQTVNVSGNVYRVAVGATTPTPVTFSNRHVGDAATQVLTVQNTAANDGFSERLNASFGSNTGSVSNNGGNVSQLAAGGSNSALSVSLDTSSAGAKSGTATLNYQSDGTGTSGLAAIAAGSQTINVTGNVYRLASTSAATPNPVNFGNVRVGAVTDQMLTISYTAANDGFSERLNASISSNGAPVVATGAFNLLGPQETNSTSLRVAIDTSSAGAKSGSATIALVSDGTGTSDLGSTALASQIVNVSGNVYRLASPTLNTPSVTLAARVGDAAPSANVSVSNSSPDIFTEGLNANIGGTSSPFTSSGSIANLAAQGTNASSLSVGLNTATAGSSTGTATVSFASTGTGTTGAADISIGEAIVNLVGKVYQQAVAQMNTVAVNFGIVHRGDVVAPVAVSVTNAAPVAGLNDVLQGSLSGASGPFSASGNLGAGVAAGATNNSSLLVGLDTSVTGQFTGSATAAFTSRNDDLSDLLLGNNLLGLTAQVNDFAIADLLKSGGEGNLFRTGQQIVLDFGDLTQGSGLHSASLRVRNNVTGFADLLDGLFQLIDTDDFTFSGFNPFFDLAAGEEQGGLSVALNTLNLGSFSDTLTLSSLGHNASGFSGALADISFLVRANIVAQGANNVPEPESLLLLAIGLAALLATRRRRNCK